MGQLFHIFVYHQYINTSEVFLYPIRKKSSILFWVAFLSSLHVKQDTFWPLVTLLEYLTTTQIRLFFSSLDYYTLTLIQTPSVLKTYYMGDKMLGDQMDTYHKHIRVLPTTCILFSYNQSS